MSTIYVRALRQVKHTVFCVDEGQKTYYDPLSGTNVPYSSGQQVKRSIMDRMLEAMDRRRAHFTFQLEEDKQGGINSRAVFSDCDPRYPDLLVGGWMRAQAGDNVKRRSPLSISALTPLHPELAATSTEVLTLDRRDDPAEAHTLDIVDKEGNEIDDVDAFFAGKDVEATRLQFTDRENNRRATGLFEYTVAVDLSRLFSIPKRSFDRELDEDLKQELAEEDWPEDEDHFFAPEAMREEIASALAEALVGWRVTSNQQRTFDLQQNLLTVVSDNAHYVANAVYVTQELDGVMPALEQTDEVAVYASNQALLHFDEVEPSMTSTKEAAKDIKNRILAVSEELPS